MSFVRPWIVWKIDEFGNDFGMLWCFFGQIELIGECFGTIIWWSAINGNPRTWMSGKTDTIDGGDIMKTLVAVSTLTPRASKFTKSTWISLSLLEHSESPSGHVKKPIEAHLSFESDHISLPEKKVFQKR